MITHFTREERHTLLFILVAIAAGVLVPPVYQPESYHHFADQRAWLSIPNFADVVSNSIFSVVGAIGLYKLRQLPAALAHTRIPLLIFFAGLLLTGPGSAYYHLAPDSGTILVDRLPMVLAFAGVIGTFVMQRVSGRMGKIALVVSLVAGLTGLALSATTGNLALYLVLQFGGLVGLIIGLLLLKKSDDPFPWWTLIGWYLVAKLLEIGDHAVWELSRHLVSGHTLKHLAAGMAGVVLLHTLTTTGRPGMRAQSDGLSRF